MFPPHPQPKSFPIRAHCQKPPAKKNSALAVLALPCAPWKDASPTHTAFPKWDTVPKIQFFHIARQMRPQLSQHQKAEAFPSHINIGARFLNRSPEFILGSCHTGQILVIPVSHSTHTTSRMAPHHHHPCGTPHFICHLGWKGRRGCVPQRATSTTLAPPVRCQTHEGKAPTSAPRWPRTQGCRVRDEFWGKQRGKRGAGNLKGHRRGGQRYQYDNKSIHLVNLGKASPEAELGSACDTLLWLLPKAGNTQPKEVHSLFFLIFLFFF